MLNGALSRRRLLLAILLTMITVIAGALVPVRAAAASAASTSRAAKAADGTVICPMGSNGPCIVIVIGPGGPGGGGPGGGGGGGGSGGACDWNGTPIPCYDPLFGWYNSTDKCYWKVLSPLPPAGDPLWQGHSPSSGLLYLVACMGPLGPGLGGITVSFSATAPPGFGGGITAGQLALTAIAALTIIGPQIKTVPATGAAGLVGMPVWLWTPGTVILPGVPAVTWFTWGPVSATASIPGLSVTATALGARIVWNMGDGTSVTCNSVGTAYVSTMGVKPSPTCGYTYKRPSTSMPGGKYVITATTTWNVSWAGGGTSGSLTVTRSSTSSLRINELQVVTQ